MGVTLLIFSVLALLALLAIQLTTGGERAHMAARIQQVRIARMSVVAGSEISQQASVRRKPGRTLSGTVGQRVALFVPIPDLLRLRLEQAGISLSTIDFSLICFLLGTASALLLWLLINLSLIQALVAGALTATMLPYLILERRSARRRELFVRQFPDAIDLVVRGVKSGLPVTESLQTAGNELTGQISSLFQEITGSIKLGKSLEEALSSASIKMPVQELRYFSISISVQQETGGNLADILQNLSSLMRRRSQVKMKINSMSSEARASAIIIGSLPFIMFALLYVVDSGYVMQLFKHRLGLILLSGGLISLVIGSSIMAKMISFEI